MGRLRMGFTKDSNLKGEPPKLATRKCQGDGCWLKLHPSGGLWCLTPGWREVPNSAQDSHPGFLSWSWLLKPGQPFFKKYWGDSSHPHYNFLWLENSPRRWKHRFASRPTHLMWSRDSNPGLQLLWPLDYTVLWRKEVGLSQSFLLQVFHSVENK